jgi:hypothetical protein
MPKTVMLLLRLQLLLPTPLSAKQSASSRYRSTASLCYIFSRCNEYVFVTFSYIVTNIGQSQLSDMSAQFDAASSRLLEATASVETLSAAAEEAQKELLAKSQQIAQLQMSLSEVEEQLVSITAREARSIEAEGRRCVVYIA